MVDCQAGQESLPVAGQALNHALKMLAQEVDVAGLASDSKPYMLAIM